MSRNKGGRPTKLTPEAVKKLEEAFAIDATVSEACFYADISRQTYYTWLEENPGFSDRFEALRNKPVLKARQTVVSSLSDPVHAFRYLEKKRGDEFGTKSKVELSGSVATEDAPSEAVQQVADEFEVRLQSVIKDAIKKKRK